MACNDLFVNPGLVLATRAIPIVGGCDAWNGAGEAVRKRALYQALDNWLRECPKLLDYPKKGNPTANLTFWRGKADAGIGAKACESVLKGLVKTVTPVAGLAALGGLVIPSIGKAITSLGKDDTPETFSQTTTVGQGGPPNPLMVTEAGVGRSPLAGLLVIGLMLAVVISVSLKKNGG